MKDFWILRIRLILIIAIIVLFIFTLKNSGDSVKDLFSNFFKSIGNQLDFFSVLFKGRILNQPSGTDWLNYFILLFLVFIPGFISLYINNLITITQKSKITVNIVFVISLILFIIFSGFMLTRDLFSLKVFEIWIFKKGILSGIGDSVNLGIKYFQENALNFLRLEGWFTFNIILFASCIFRSMFKVKTPSFSSFMTSIVFEIFRLFILISLIKYATFLSVMKITI